MSRRAGVNTNTVVEAAIELIDAEGLDQLSLARLAEKLGIRTPSLYNHISGLEGLRRDLALRGFQELTKRLRLAATGRNAEDGVKALAEAYRDFAEEHPGLYASTLRAPDPTDTTLRDASVELVQIALAVIAPFGLSEAEAIHSVRGMRSLLHGFVTLKEAGGFGMPLDVNDTFEYLIEMFLSGLRLRGASAQL